MIARALYRALGEAAGAYLRAGGTGGDANQELRRRERLGQWQGGPPASRWIWLHGASVGEVAVAAALGREIGARLEGIEVVVTCQTVTGRRRLAEIHPGPAHYLPLDWQPAIQAVLARSRPRLFVSIETEIWPELLASLAREGVPAAMANARISDASFPRYRRIRPLIAPALRSLSAVCARDPVSAGRLLELGAPADVMRVTGDLKLDLASPRITGESHPAVSRDPARLLLVAGSTHEGEDEVVLDAYAVVREAIPGARLVLAPRHPERADKVAEMAAARGGRIMKSSAMAGEGVAAESWDVLVLDQIGRLPDMYACAQAAFVGGSLVPGPGGHNLLEPVEHEMGVAAGPLLSNVAESHRLLEAAGCLVVVNDSSELARVWLDMLEHRRRFREAAVRARAMLAERGGALHRTADVLARLVLEPQAPRPADAAPQKQSRLPANRSPLVERVWYGNGRAAAAGRAGLAPLSALFAAGANARGRLFDAGLLAVRRAPAPVISIGALSAGGSGKTPAVLWLVQQLAARGLRPCVVMRGYGAGASEPRLLRPEQATFPASVAAAGDEAALLAARGPVDVAVAARRIDACELAWQSLRPDLFVLDDGFQHRALHRDLDIVLVDAREAGDRLLPAGPLREPPAALARAGVILWRGRGDTPSWIGRANPSALVLRVEARAEGLVESVRDARPAPMTDLAGRKVAAVAAIARPERFLAMLEEAGAEIVATILQRDHHVYDMRAWSEIARLAPRVDLVVTTEKDLIKLAALQAKPPRWLRALRIGLQVEDQESLMARVLDASRRDRAPDRART